VWKLWGREESLASDENRNPAKFPAARRCADWDISALVYRYFGKFVSNSVYTRMKLHKTLITFLSVSQQLIIIQPVEKFPTFYGNRKIILVFTRASRWSLSWAIWIRSTTSHPIHLRSILILCSHLRFADCLVPSVASTNILYALLFSAIRDACLAQLMLLDLFTLIIEYEVRTMKYGTSHYDS
jgi:hypothetical protein